VFLHSKIERVFDIVIPDASRLPAGGDHRIAQGATIPASRLAQGQGPSWSWPSVRFRVLPGPGMVRLSSRVLRPQWWKRGMV
jgi:hypothetical protein